MYALQFGQLHLAVHAQGFGHVIGLGRDHFHAIGHGGGDHVGQVVLTLGIVVGEIGQPLAQQRGGCGDDAGVDFLDGALGRAGILLLDDGDDLAVFAHDAAIAVRVLQRHSQHAQLVLAGRIQQALQRGGGGQGNVAVEHQRGSAILQVRQRLHHGVAGAQLRLLLGEGQALVGKGIGDGITAMTVDHAQLAGRERTGGIDHMTQERFPGQRVQDLGEGGLHAFAHAGGEDDDVHDLA